MVIISTDPEDPRQIGIFKSPEEEMFASTRKLGSGGMSPSERAKLTPRHSHPNKVPVQEEYSGSNVEHPWGRKILIRCAIKHDHKLKWYCSVCEVQCSPRNASGTPARTMLSNAVTTSHKRPIRHMKLSQN